MSLLASPGVAGRWLCPCCPPQARFAAPARRAVHAKEKRAKKKIPLLAANLAQDALGADDNEITLYDDAGEHPLGRGSKLEQARKLIGHIASMIERGKRRA